MSINLAHRQHILGRLMQFADQPAWKAWAWHAAKEFEQINPYDLSGLQEELRQQMIAKKERDETSSNRDGDSRPLN